MTTERKIQHTPFAGAPRFAECGQPGADGGCLWCGRRLRLNRHRSALAEHRGAEPVLARGDYADGAFCGLRCGYAFAVQAAIDGIRYKAAP